MQVESISLMPYSHADWAWNYYRAWHVKRYIRAFEMALDLMDEHPDFTWFIDTYTDQFRVVLENRPDLVGGLDLVEDGVFNVSLGGPGTIDVLDEYVARRQRRNDVLPGKAAVAAGLAQRVDRPSLPLRRAGRDVGGTSHAPPVQQARSLRTMSQLRHRQRLIVQIDPDQTLLSCRNP